MKTHTITCNNCGRDFVGKGYSEQRAYNKAMEEFSEHECCTNYNARLYDLNIKPIREDEDYVYA